MTPPKSFVPVKLLAVGADATQDGCLEVIPFEAVLLKRMTTLKYFAGCLLADDGPVCLRYNVFRQVSHVIAIMPEIITEDKLLLVSNFMSPPDSSIGLKQIPDDVFGALKKVLALVTSTASGAKTVSDFTRCVVEPIAPIAQNNVALYVNICDALITGILNSIDVAHVAAGSTNVAGSESNETDLLGALSKSLSLHSARLDWKPPVSKSFVSRVADGLSQDSNHVIHDCGPPRFFVGAAPPAVGFEESVRRIGLEAVARDHLKISYSQCSRCKRLTSDPLEVHAANCTEGPSGVEFASMNEDIVINLSTSKVVIDPVTQLELKMPHLTAYTLESPIYRHMNQLLRGIYSPHMQEQFQRLYGAYFVGTIECLRNLPIYTGTVYRGLDFMLRPELYMAGSIITWPAFSSTTAQPSVIKQFIGSGDAPKGTIFVIRSKTGRNVRDFSNIPEEEEVLFLPGTQFRVVRSVDIGMRNLLAYAMQVQLDESAVAIFELEEVVVRTHDHITEAMSPAQKDQWSAKIWTQLKGHRYRGKVREYVRQEDPTSTSEDTYRVKFDGEVRSATHLLASHVEGTSMLIEEGVKGCDPSVLKVVLAGIDPTQVQVERVRRWIRVFAAARGETGRASLSPTVAWLFSWAHQFKHDVFAGADDSFKWEIATALAGCPAAAVYPERITGKLLPTVLTTPGLTIGRLLRANLETGSPVVFRWLLNQSAGTEGLEGHTEIVRLRFRVNKNADGDAVMGAPALTAAVLRGRVDPDAAAAMVQELVSRGADVGAVDSDHGFPVQYAAGLGDARIMSALLASQMDAAQLVKVLNQGDNMGHTPLMMASKIGCVEVMSALIAKGADVNIKSADNETALMFACQNGKPLAVRLLLDKGADPTVITNLGFTALYLACDNVNERAALLLIENLLTKHADRALQVIKHRTTNKFTCVMAAAARGASLCVKELLAIVGAAEHAASCLEAAVERHHSGVVQVLLGHDGVTVPDSVVRIAVAKEPRDMSAEEKRIVRMLLGTRRRANAAPFVVTETLAEVHVERANAVLQSLPDVYDAQLDYVND